MAVVPLGGAGGDGPGARGEELSPQVTGQTPRAGVEKHTERAGLTQV